MNNDFSYLHFMFIRLILFIILLGFINEANAQCPIIPTPSVYEEHVESLKFDKLLTISSNSISENNLAFLKEQLNDLFSINIIESKKNANIQFERSIKLVSSYEININESIVIKYKEDVDAFYAISSLLQLIEEKENTLAIKKCHIKDTPEFQWRGLHLDVTRHFFTVDEVKRYIDLMAFYKFNTFHWHLTDDQGWRIEIKQYPKLTEVGAFRDSTIIGHYNANPRVYEKKKYGGFYSQEEIKEVVQYAASKYITVVPEIEMPGHARAAIAAYPELSCNEQFLPVPGLWGVFEDIFCSKPKTIEFLKDVLDEVVELFPSEYIHIGGDEALKERWNHCDQCKKTMSDNGLTNAHELQSYFIQQIDDYLSSKGKKIIGWDEMLEGGLSTNAAVMSWRGEVGGIEAANQKHNVVMSPTTYAYFDYYQSGSSTEPLAIGGFLPLEKVYNYTVIPKDMPKDAQQFVLGGQANLWTEYIQDFSHAEYMVYPRALALIQNLWSSNKLNYDDFLTVFAKTQEPLLQKMNVNYSRSVYLPELNISRINGGVKYMFTSKAEEAFDLSKESYPFDAGVGLEILNIKGNSLEISRIPFLYNDGFTIKLKSKLLSNEISYNVTQHKGIGLPIELITKPHPKYSNGGDLTLVDGMKGARPWKGDQWLGFNEELIELVIDVSELDTVNSITVGFLDAKGSWIYLPESIRVCVQELDGTISCPDYLKVTKEYQEIEVHEKADKLRLLIYPKKEIPAGAEGAGQIPWTFIDEIIIK